VPAIWGYQNLNGPAGLALSALKKFGLVDDEGTKDERRVRVTDLAVQILNHPSSDARETAIKDAALIPPIHREMWEEYGTHLPSDANLMWRLTRNRGFTETGAKEFIREWRETMEYAQLSRKDASAAHLSEEVGLTDEVTTEPIAGPDPESEPYEPQADVQPQTAGYQFPAQQAKQIMDAHPRAQDPAVQDYKIPIALAGRPPVTITGAFPLSEAEWTQFMAILSAMKPVLVGAPMPPADHTSIAAGEQVASKVFAQDGDGSEAPTEAS
jgi:hypothetical protein